MKKNTLLLALVFIFIISSVSYAMIDTFAFKLTGKVLSIKQWPVNKNAKLKIKPQYEMEIEILEVLSKNVRLGPYRQKTKVQIHNAYSNKIDLKTLKRGNIIIGDFMSMETEQHPRGGYKINRSLKITSLKGDKKMAADGINQFSIDLYSKLKDRPRNLFYSPYSISTALSMVYAGADGETASQMKKVLHFDQSHSDMEKLINELNTPNEYYKLIVANALWGQKGYKFKNNYKNILKNQYKSELSQLDFIKKTEKSRKTINQWVEKKTNDKIKDLLKPGTVDPLTRLILTNAIYFKANWSEQFEKENTKEDTFYISKKDKIRVQMMHQNNALPYYENRNMQMVELPYERRKLSMVVILPKKTEGINSINIKDLAKWGKELSYKKVNLYLPKFKITSEFSLKKILSSMGMKDAFSLPPADFSGISGTKDLFISNVIHKAYVDVNEEGTEAAAATAIGMAKSSFDPSLPKKFKADHPFIFLIKDNNSGTILFMGRVVKP